MMVSRVRDVSLAELVVRARSPRGPGHEAAFAEIVRRFRTHAHGAAFRALGDPALAQDAAQEAFLDAYLGLDRLRDPAAFPGWFGRIVFKHADRIRRRPRSLPEGLEAAEQEPGEGLSPEAWAETRENVAEVRRALVGLPEHERDVVVLFYFAGRSHAEIGERLSLPISTVKKRLHDARRHLRIPLETLEHSQQNASHAGGAAVSTTQEPAHALRPQTLSGAEALRLAALATPKARGVLYRFAPEQVASALQELSAADRVRFLEVSDRLPEIVPCVPEVALTQTIRGVGMEEAGWLVEFASPEQRVAALDLDAWQDRRLSPSRVFEWIDALIEAGTETLLAAFDELDAELWILALQWMAEFTIPEGFLDDAEYELPEGSTPDGIVFYQTRSSDYDERVAQILETARSYAPPIYWDFVYGAVTESPRSCEEGAARWHQARLNDLGFPDVERAMAVYKPLPVAAVPVVASLTPPPPEASPVPALLTGTRIGEALAELPEDRALEVQGDLFALANAIAVADRLPLTDADALQYALRKAAAGVDRGLAALAREQYRSLGETVDTTPVRDLFRVGATLHAELRPQQTLGELEEKEDAPVGFDWDVLEEWITEADQTLGPDGKLRF